MKIKQNGIMDKCVTVMVRRHDRWNYYYFLNKKRINVLLLKIMKGDSLNECRLLNGTTDPMDFFQVRQFN